MDEKTVAGEIRESLIDPTFSTELAGGRRKWRTLTIEWSYSSIELILDHGIDYAVALQRGDLNSKAARLGQTRCIFSAWRRGSFAISFPLIFGQGAARAWRSERKPFSKHHHSRHVPRLLIRF